MLKWKKSFQRPKRKKFSLFVPICLGNSFSLCPLQEVKREELPELKGVFSKIFDPDMSPLGFDAKEMYR